MKYTSTPSIQADRPKHNYKNATDLNAMIDDLRPNTEYEFTVKVGLHFLMVSRILLGDHLKLRPPPLFVWKLE